MRENHLVKTTSVRYDEFSSILFLLKLIIF